MNDLATLAINAHGGLDRWRRLKAVSAHLLQGGVLWNVKGQDGVLDDVHPTVDLRKEWASHRPFGQQNLHSSFQPDRVAIETSDGQVVDERRIRIATCFQDATLSARTQTTQSTCSAASGIAMRISRLLLSRYRWHTSVLAYMALALPDRWHVSSTAPRRDGRAVQTDRRTSATDG
jgi:hypothetical protein